MTTDQLISQALGMVEQLDEVKDWLTSDNPILQQIAAQTFDECLAPATILLNEHLLTLQLLDHQHIRILEARLAVLLRDERIFNLASTQWGQDWAKAISRPSHRSRGVDV